MKSFSKTAASAATDAGPSAPLRVAYSLAAGAAAATSAIPAAADIVYSGTQNLSIAQFNSLNLDIDGDTQGDVTLKNYVFGGGNYQGAVVNFVPGKIVGFNAGLSYVTALSAGALVDSTTAGPSFFGSMAYGTANPNAQFNNASGKFVGLSFPSGTSTYYGWVRVDVSNSAGSFVVKDWAYQNTPGVGILTGVVPEPTSLGLLAAGAAGVAALRLRKRA
jgi:hypothetical protein